MGLKASRQRYMYHVCLHDRRKCSPVNVVSSDIRVMQIFAGVREIWDVKQFVSSYYISMISLHNAVARLLSVSYGLSCCTSGSFVLSKNLFMCRQKLRFVDRRLEYY